MRQMDDGEGLLSDGVLGIGKVTTVDGRDAGGYHDDATRPLVSFGHNHLTKGITRGATEGKTVKEDTSGEGVAQLVEQRTFNP